MSHVSNAGAPTPRRSGRLSTKASSVAESGVAIVTGSSTRQRRSGPLTKVKARKSNAYGASGRVGAAEELSVSTTGFAQAFQNQRGNAFTRDEENDGENNISSDDDDTDELAAPSVSKFINQIRHAGQLSPNSVKARTSGSRSQAAPGLSFMESDDNVPSDDDGSVSVSNTSKSFGPSHEAGMLVSQERAETRFPSPPARRGFQARVARQTIVQAQTPIQVQAQAPVRRTFRTEARPEHPAANRTPANRIEVEQAVDELIAEEAANAPQANPQPPSLHGARETFDRVARDLQTTDWWRWIKMLAWGFGGLTTLVLLSLLAIFAFSSASPDSASRASTLATALSSRADHTFTKITDLIRPSSGPTRAEQVAAFKSNEDDYLWDRILKVDTKIEERYADIENTLADLREQLPQIMIVHRHLDGRSEISDEFWTALIAKARSSEEDPEWIEYLARNKARLRDLLDPTVPKGDHTVYAGAVSRQEFTKIIQEQYHNISTRVDEKILKSVQDQKAELTAITHAETRKALLDSIRLTSLAQTNLVANYELHLTKPNYFSPGLGAIVDPTMSSQTFLNHQNLLLKVARFASLAQTIGVVPQRNPPKYALTKWDEPGDCWCSAPTTSKTPSAAQLAVTLARPMYPKQVTIEHIPKSMVPTGNLSSAPRSMELWVQTDKPVNPYYSHRLVECQGAPELEGWKCLGSFRYNVHASNHLQTFDLAAEPAEAVTRAIVRVTRNWGADHTCLYQVRLHGEDAAEAYRYEMGLMD